jgi:hypothetical protein
LSDGPTAGRSKNAIAFGCIIPIVSIRTNERPEISQWAVIVNWFQRVSSTNLLTARRR